MSLTIRYSHRCTTPSLTFRSGMSNTQSSLPLHILQQKSSPTSSADPSSSNIMAATIPLVTASMALIELAKAVQHLQVDHVDSALTTRLPDTTHDKIVTLNPNFSQNQQSSDMEMAPPARPASQPEKVQGSSITFLEYAKFNNSSDPEVRQIDGVTIPPHLLNMVQLDSFDFTFAQGSKVACRLGYKFQESATTPANLKIHCLKQNSGAGRVEAVLYSRKRKAPEDDADSEDFDDDMDARGRMIERVVWSNREHDSAPAKRPCLPNRDRVFMRAASSESSLYQTPHPIATSSPAVEFKQTLLFSSHAKRGLSPSLQYKSILHDSCLYLGKTTPARRRRKPSLLYKAMVHTLHDNSASLHKAEVANQQEALRKERGGLMIDFENRLKMSSKDIGRNAKIADAYATALEGWERDLKGSEGGKGKAWITSMWEMPEKK
jgi:hypothetical protein